MQAVHIAQVADALGDGPEAPAAQAVQDAQQTQEGEVTVVQAVQSAQYNQLVLDGSQEVCDVQHVPTGQQAPAAHGQSQPTDMDAAAADPIGSDNDGVERVQQAAPSLDASEHAEGTLTLQHPVPPTQAQQELQQPVPSQATPSGLLSLQQGQAALSAACLQEQQRLQNEQPQAVTLPPAQQEAQLHVLPPTPAPSQQQQLQGLQLQVPPPSTTMPQQQQEAPQQQQHLPGVTKLLADVRSHNDLTVTDVVQVCSPILFSAGLTYKEIFSALGVLRMLGQEQLRAFVDRTMPFVELLLEDNDIAEAKKVICEQCERARSGLSA